MAPATHGLLGRILRANDDASRRFGENTAEVDAFIRAAAQLTPWQWRQVLTARRLVSTVTKEDVVQATESLQAVRAAIQSTEGRLSEPMSKAGESLFEALDHRSDDKVATAWQALSALVLREHLSPLKFGAHYAPFITLIPVAGFDALDPTTMRFLTAVQALSALVLREHLSPLKFGAHYAPFITLIPVAGFDALDPTTMRFLTAVQALTK